jgi:hypothetical protein
MDTSPETALRQLGFFRLHLRSTLQVCATALKYLYGYVSRNSSAGALAISSLRRSSLEATICEHLADLLLWGRGLGREEFTAQCWIRNGSLIIWSTSKSIGKKYYGFAEARWACNVFFISSIVKLYCCAWDIQVVEIQESLEAKSDYHYIPFQKFLCSNKFFREFDVWLHVN